EIKTTAAMSHPHILPLFDSGSADGFLFYVMPYIQGETIREKLNRESQFGVEEAIRIAREVADALDYAHRHGVIHRDIKPENVLLHDGRAMVMDFGIALAVSAAAGGRMTETGLSLGTPHYMSPEQATAEKEITAKADQYSLASVLYEMLTGNPPHTGATAQQIIMKIITEPAEPVTKLRKSVPPHVAAALSTALEKLSADRFENMKAFADALRDTNYTNARSTSDASRNTGARVSVFGSRGVMVASWALTALAVSAAVAGWMRRQPTSSAPVVRFTMPMSGEQSLQNATSDAPFVLSPDGTKLAYFASEGATTSKTLHVRALDQFTTTSIRGTESGYSPFFSPDGLWIGYLTRQREIKKVSASGGPITTLVTGTALFRGAPSWGDDHTILYSGQGAGPLWRVSDAGGAPTLLLDSSKVAGLAPFLLPGSNTALYNLCGSSDKSSTCFLGDLGVVDLSARTVRVLVPGAARGWYLPSGHLIYATVDGALFAATFDIASLKITSAPVKVLDGIEMTGYHLPVASISASGTLAYLPTGAAGGNRVLVQRDRSGREETIIAKLGHYEAPRFSPDGQRLALVDEDNKLITEPRKPGTN
ncbi:MAG: protein kinase, partial [Gemmatimonas sp.]